MAVSSNIPSQGLHTVGPIWSNTMKPNLGVLGFGRLFGSSGAAVRRLAWQRFASASVSAGGIQPKGFMDRRSLNREPYFNMAELSVRPK